MAKLTDGKSGTLARAEAPATGQRFIFDDHRDAPRGFALRITAAGGKAFVLQYTVDGRQRRKTIGDWPTWSLEAARIEARDLAQQIAKGTDPLEEKRRRKAEPTLKELAGDWLDKATTGLKSEKAIRGYINNDLLPALGHIKVTDIRRRDVIEVIEAKAEKTPRAAANVLIYARRLLDYATDRDFIPANPLAGLKPSSITVKGKRDPLKAVARGRVLDHDEIRAFWHSVETCGLHRLTALALKLVLVTGQRPGEVSGMREDEISGRWWTIPANRRGKTETDHTVYLTDTALQIIADAKAEIDRLHKRRKEPWSGNVFEARPGKPLTRHAVSRAVARYHAELGAKVVEPWGRWTPHDLRRSMRTGLSAAKVRPDISEIVIGHVIPGIRGVYDRHDFKDELRAAALAWEARLLAIVDGRDPDAKDSADVIQLEAAR
ncbi:MAG: integrase [Rhodobacteraceae bacterium CG17_big_fil_post_rev_8_21_14_2_50_63_15]|nr:integrase arm-type DNA-binding domain-containing protein [Roseovarius sp.]PIV79075.1 MAG: integrase [Rhodobacteraceae bacterium CG17_big_fil_post_rev_8_21_14_2_50_63_15]